MKPRASFVIPVRNDAARLDACLKSIRRNSHVPGQIEIIVVDNGSTDGSAQVAADPSVNPLSTTMISIWPGT